MVQYIDKSALVAEIKKHQKIWDGMEGDYCKGQRLAYSDMLSFLDTLEVKEVEISNDAFIEKACEFISRRVFNCAEGSIIEDFKKYMKEE